MPSKKKGGRERSHHTNGVHTLHRPTRASLLWASRCGDTGTLHQIYLRALELAPPIIRHAAHGDIHSVTSMLREMPEAAGIVEVVTGHTALTVAALEGDDEAVQVLLQSPHCNAAHADAIGGTALTYASGGGHVTSVRLLVERPGPRLNLSQPNIAGMTALMCAASRGHLATVQLLLRTPHFRPVLSELMWARELAKRAHHTEVANAIDEVATVQERWLREIAEEIAAQAASDAKPSHEHPPAVLDVQDTEEAQEPTDQTAVAPARAPTSSEAHEQADKHRLIAELLLAFELPETLAETFVREHMDCDALVLVKDEAHMANLDIEAAHFPKLEALIAALRAELHEGEDPEFAARRLLISRQESRDSSGESAPDSTQREVGAGSGL